MREVAATELELGLQGVDLARLRMACVALTAASAFFIGLPCALSWLAPRPLPPIDDPGPSMDGVLSVLLMGQVLLFTLSFALQSFWPRLGRRRPSGDEAWTAEWVAQAISKTWLLRFAASEGVCILGAIGFYMAYTQGLLTEAPRIWFLGVIPLFALAWMFLHWPDAVVLKKAFPRSKES